MRVLWLVRRNLREHPGGDTVQLEQTAAALGRLGVAVDMRSECPATIPEHDLVHLFHLDRLWENLDHLRRVQSAGRPVVLSPIWWPADEFDRGGRAGVQGWLARRLGSEAYQGLRLMQRYLLHCRECRCVPRPARLWTNFVAAARELLRGVAAILPNSRAEAEQIEQRFGIRRPACVVPNGADTARFRLPVAPAARDGALSVGRIEPRKNQLGLIRALRGSGIPLTIVGGAGRFNRRYERRCRAAADEHVRFLPARPAEELPALYHAAAVHACVSWYETPGLASIEAALCGCALVVTPGGCTREYFGADAAYCRPDDAGSIRGAVEEALVRGPSARLAQRLVAECTWDAAAARTRAAYRVALGCAGHDDG